MFFSGITAGMDEDGCNFLHTKTTYNKATAIAENNNNEIDSRAIVLLEFRRLNFLFY